MYFQTTKSGKKEVAKTTKKSFKKERDTGVLIKDNSENLKKVSNFECFICGFKVKLAKKIIIDN